MQFTSLRLKRKSKPGLFYILQYNNHFKYGATTLSVTQRLQWAKKKTGYNYEIIYVKKCSDVFNFEKRFKWRLGEFYIVNMTEFFEAPPGFTAETFKKIADSVKI